MGRRGAVQVVHCTYGDCAISDWVQKDAYDYLCKRGIEVSIPDDMSDPQYADAWEIIIPQRRVKNKYVPNFTKIQRAIDDLTKHPDRIRYENTEYGDNLACMLEEGVKAAKKHGYTVIAIDWF